MVEAVVGKAGVNVQRGFFIINGCTAVALAFRRVEEGVVAVNLFKRVRQLVFGGLELLNAEYVGLFGFDPVDQPFLFSGADAVDVP